MSKKNSKAAEAIKKELRIYDDFRDSVDDQIDRLQKELQSVCEHVFDDMREVGIQMEYCPPYFKFFCSECGVERSE